MHSRCEIYVNFIDNFFSLCRDGRVKVGDEIINVCGKRLRGLTIEDAIKALKQPQRELDIVVARDQVQEKQHHEFFNEDRLRDEHRRIAQKIHAYDFQETCSEVNLYSRPKTGICSSKFLV